MKAPHLSKPNSRMPGHKLRWVGVVCRSGPDHYHRRFAPVKSELGRHVLHLGHASSWTAESRPHCRLDGPHCPMQLGSQPIGFDLFLTCLLLLSVRGVRFTSTRSSDRKSRTRHSQFQIIQSQYCIVFNFKCPIHWIAGYPL